MSIHRILLGFKNEVLRRTVMIKGEPIDADHVSVKPQARPKVPTSVG